MTAFEQFIAQEYGRKEGDDIDDIYDEARSRWKQMRSMPIDDNARAAQGVFDSIPENPPSPTESLAGPYDGDFNLLTPNSTNLFADLPDSTNLRQEQAREMEIAQRQASGAAGDVGQPESLPDDLVNQVWRSFSQDYLDFTRRAGGAMRSDARKQLIDDWNQGFAENYAPVFNMTLSEAENVAKKAASENRPVQLNDWKVGTETAPTETEQRQVNPAKEAADVAKYIKDISEVNPELAAQLKDQAAVRGAVSIYNSNLEDPAMFIKQVDMFGERAGVPVDKKDPLAQEEQEEYLNRNFNVFEETYLFGKKQGKPSPVVPIPDSLTDTEKQNRFVEAGDRNARVVLKTEDGKYDVRVYTPELAQAQITAMAEAALARARKGDESEGNSPDSYVLRGAMELGKLGVSGGTKVAKKGARAAGAMTDLVTGWGLAKKQLEKYNLNPEVIGELQSFVTAASPVQAATKLSVAAVTALDRIGRAATAKDDDKLSR